MLTDDFKDMLSTFIDEGVEFLLIGAHAMAVHGVVRATADIDLWVRPSPDNADRVWRALVRFGAPAEQFSRDDFLEPDVILQLGVVPNRIDVLTSIAGVEFDAAWRQHHVHKIDGLSVPVIARSDLIQNKRSTGRDQDAIDADRLEGAD